MLCWGSPWLSQLNVAKYYYIDQNTYHSTYGDILYSFIPWDTVYVDRLKKLITHLAEKYSADSRISYWNLIAGQMSRNLPDSVVTDQGKKAFPAWSGYKADTLVKRMNEVLDVYMKSFPNTPLWALMDYQRFEPAYSGNPKNYVAQKFSDYGIAYYPDRFGVWREDLSACNPNLSTLQSGSQWYIMKENPCRAGAQMVWSVQNGPTRMNQCGVVPNTEAFVLDSAVQHGITMGMRYIEIYGADINDTSLDEIITKANNLLIAKGNACTGVKQVTSEISEQLFCIFPNPSQGIFTLKTNGEYYSAEIFSVCGQLVFKEQNLKPVSTINLCNQPLGIYFLKLYSGKDFLTRKLELVH